MAGPNPELLLLACAAVLLFPSLVIRVPLLVALNPWMIFGGPTERSGLGLTIDDGRARRLSAPFSTTAQEFRGAANLLP